MQTAPMNSSDAMASQPPVVVIIAVSIPPTPPVSIVVIIIVVIVIVIVPVAIPIRSSFFTVLSVIILSLNRGQAR
jgi:hypothetical protein